jgi:hypothetical protein
VCKIYFDPNLGAWAETPYRIDRDSLTSAVYDDHEVYSGLPTYEWRDSFNFKNLAFDIDLHNDVYRAALRGFHRNHFSGRKDRGPGDCMYIPTLPPKIA